MEEAGNGSQDAPEKSGEERGVGRGGGEGEEPAGVGGEGKEGILSGGGGEVGIHGGVGGAVSGDDDVLGEPDGKTGGDDEVGCMGQLICIYPYVPSIPPQSCSVERNERRKGLGSTLVSIIEGIAKNLGTQRLYLYTLKPAGFYTRLG